RKARSEERIRVAAAQAASTPASVSEEKPKAAKSDSVAKTASDKPVKAKRKGRIATYLTEVRSEIRRVVWPSKEELTNYSVAVIATLVVFGVVIWLVDNGIVAALIGYTGLRG
ncbi:MAG: preprotein translocase subunit SecE, partial [Olsenella sp.]